MLVEQDLTFISTPFLLNTFAKHGLPDVHLYTNANERLVYAYSQCASDQTARGEGSLREEPKHLVWSFDTVLITNTETWNVSTVESMLTHMARDKTGAAYVIAKDSNCSVFRVLQKHSVIAPMRIESVLREGQDVMWLPVILKVTTRVTRAIPCILFRMQDLVDVRELFRLTQSTAYRNQGAIVTERLRIKDNGVGGWPQGKENWWAAMTGSWVTQGCGDNNDQLWQYSSLHNKKYMRPHWMKGWYWDEAELPPMELLRCPGNERTTAAEPLPDPPSDTYSAMVWQEAIVPYPDVFRISTPLRVDALEAKLDSYPNKPHSDSWLKALRQGLWPWSGNFGNDPPEGVVIPNASNMDQHRKFINSVRIKETALGHWRKLSVIPKFFRTSRISVVPKPEGGNRLIQNLSYPEGNSVNDQIPEIEGKVRYDDIASLARVIVRLHIEGKKGWIPWKLDVSRAFRNLPLHPLFALRNGIMLKSRKKKLIAYIDSQACFGGRTFPRAFCSLADVVDWIATKGLDEKVYILLRFVDDHFGISPIEAGEEEPRDMAILRRLFGELGIPTNEKCGYGNGIVIIGKEVDYENATIQLSKEKIVRYMSTCGHYIRRESLTLAEVEHVCGVLDYCVEMLPTGKPFNRAFYRVKAANYGKRSSTELPVTDEMKESLRWWARALACRPIRHLLKERWWSSIDAEEIIFTDASTSGGLGFYWMNEKKAYYHEYDTSSRVIQVLQGDRKGAIIHIGVMEMLAVLSAVQVAAKGVQSKGTSVKARLLIMCDNSGVCDAVWKMKSGCPVMNELLKDLTGWLRNIDLRVCHISTGYNPADMLTKGLDKRELFVKMFPVDLMMQVKPQDLQEYYQKHSGGN